MHVADLAEALSRKAIRCEAICSPASRLDERLREKDIHTHTIKSGGYVRPIAMMKAVAILQKTIPDAIHVHYSKDLWWLIPALLFYKKIPVLLSKHIGTQKPKRDFLHHFLYTRLRFIIAISNVIRENIIATHPIHAENVVVVHHGVKLERYNPEIIDRAAQRRQLGYDDKQLVLGIIGRLQASKGYIEFLEMAAAIRAEYPNVRFLMIGEASRGEDDEAQKILKKIETARLWDVVQWCGFRQDVPEMLSAMDIFIFPSHAEAFGLVLIEAMSMAKPVISSNCDGVLDIVVDGECGLLTPPKDVPALISATKLLINNEELRTKFSQNARQRAVKYFVDEKKKKKIRELYVQAVKEF